MLYVAVGVLVPLALAARAAAGRWLRPAALFAGFWAIAGIFPLIGFESPRVGARSIIYIAVAVALFAGGALLSGGAGALPRRPRPQVGVNRELLIRTIRIGSAAGFAAGLLALYNHGLSAVNLLSVAGILESGHTIAVERYSGTSGTYLGAVLLGLNFAAAIIAPYATVLDATIKRRWLFVPFLAALFYSTVTTEKLALLLAGIATVSGYLAARTMQAGDAPRVTRRGVYSALAAVAVVAVAFGAIAFVRLGSADSRDLPTVREKVSVYAFGYGPGFSVWLDGYTSGRRSAPPLGWGTATVAGASVLTGQSRSGTRAYNEHVMINDAGATTNIYTLFRSLLIDFGTPGAALALFGFGLAAGTAYRRATVDGSPVAAGILGCLYVCVLLSNFMSVVSFTNMLAAMIIAVIVLRRSAQSATADEPVPVSAGCRLKS